MTVQHSPNERSASVEQRAPATREENLDDVARAAALATEAFEAQLNAMAGQIEIVKHDVEFVRSRVQREREEMDIEHSLDSGSQYIIDSPDSGELRAMERAPVSYTHLTLPTICSV